MSDEQRSVTGWIGQLKMGDNSEAARLVWDRYFHQLARLAQSWLRTAAGGVVDGEDVALSAIDSFCRGVGEGRFPSLANRNELWKLLYTITARKAFNRRRREAQLKRGGGRVVADIDLGAEGSDGNALARFADDELGPELTVAVADEMRHLFAVLEDESLRVVALLRMEGYTNDDIAAALDCSLRSVERRVQTIRTTWESASAAQI
jgi:DNA-directed RNA polymerase specialized sigma24 family protein